MKNTVTTIRELANKLYGDKWALTDNYIHQGKYTFKKVYSLDGANFFSCKVLVDMLKAECEMSREVQ